MSLQKPHLFTISIWYGANIYIPDKIPNSWKCENPMLIWYLFNKCGWLGYYVFSLHVFLHVWLNVTGALLLRPTQWVLTYRGQLLSTWPGYVSVSHAMEIHWANLHCILHMLTVYGILYTVLWLLSLNHAVIYATALR